MLGGVQLLRTGSESHRVLHISGDSLSAKAKLWKWKISPRLAHLFQTKIGPLFALMCFSLLGALYAFLNKSHGACAAFAFASSSCAFSVYYRCFGTYGAELEGFGDEGASKASRRVEFWTMKAPFAVFAVWSCYVFALAASIASGGASSGWSIAALALLAAGASAVSLRTRNAFFALGAAWACFWVFHSNLVGVCTPSVGSPASYSIRHSGELLVHWDVGDEETCVRVAAKAAVQCGDDDGAFRRQFSGFLAGLTTCSQASAFGMCDASVSFEKPAKHCTASCGAPCDENAKNVSYAWIDSKCRRKIDCEDVLPPGYARFGESVCAEAPSVCPFRFAGNEKKEAEFAVGLGAFVCFGVSCVCAVVAGVVGLR